MYGKPGIEPSALFKSVQIRSGDDNVSSNFKRDEMNGDSGTEHDVDSVGIFSDVEVVEVHHGSVAHTKHLARLLPCDGDDAVDLSDQIWMLSQQYCDVGERAEGQERQPARVKLSGQLSHSVRDVSLTREWLACTLSDRGQGPLWFMGMHDVQ